MNLVGLTGGIGMGKSTAAQWLAEHQIPVVDTDLIAREIVAPGCPANTEIQAAFGSEVVGPNGALKREALAQLVFSDEQKRKQLEAITHPRIRHRWLAQVSVWRKEGRPVAVVVIPLLFEVGASNDFDTIVCVACSEATQRARLHQRGWTEQQINRRIIAQGPIDQKMSRSHRVLWTEGQLEVLAQQLEYLLPRLQTSAAK